MGENADSKLLDVISASAGSGKTYSLASRFIDMLVRNPQNYQHILAVTFTIKATAEMMDRIVKDLYILVAPIADDDKRESREKERQEIIARQIEELKGGQAKDVDGKLVRPRPMTSQFRGKTDHELSQIIVDNCKLALHLILNDYSQFNISTIDSFVQKVIRAFAFEQGFMSNYSVELDTDLIIDHSIDMLMQTLNTDALLKGWMIEFVKSKMESDESSGSWEIDGDIKKLAYTLKSDEGRVFAEEIRNKLKENPDFIKDYKKAIDKAIEEADDNINKAVDRYVEMLPADFSVNMVNGKSRSYRFKLYELKGKDYKTEILKKIEYWKKDDKYKNTPSGHEGVERAYEAFWRDVNDTLKKRNTAKKIKSNIYVIGILGYISKMMQEYATENHVMLLAKSNELLKELIGNSTVPFIYEKIGTRFNNIMIDEFQDTSVMQWDNFEPLVANCLHNNNRCLLVGDVKQAIYRWRNSDWHTLADLGTTSGNNSVDTYVKNDNLDTNWRSQENIVSFNNSVFNLLSRDFSQKIGTNNGKESDFDIDRIYNESSQKTKKESLKGKGFVQSKTVICKKDEGSDIILPDLVKTINDLTTNHGYKLNDILILTRDNKTGSVVVDYLAKNNVTVVSSDSLMVCNSLTVKGIIAALNYIANPENTQALLAFVSTRYADKDISEISELWKNNEEMAAIKDSLVSLRGKGLLEMVNTIINMMPERLRKSDFIFVEAFMDALRNFMANYHVNLSDFIDYLNTVQGKLAITAPSNQEAITVMTIHKSKGLERKVVLIPFADWDIEPNSFKRPIIWGHNLPDPFGAIDSIPVVYDSSLIDTYISEAYLEEQRMIYIDNLNMLYVALTRAKEVMMMWGRIPAKNSESVSMYLSEAIKRSADTLPIAMTTEEIEQDGMEEEEDGEGMIFEVMSLGEISSKTEIVQKGGPKDDIISETITPYEIHDYTIHSELTQRNSKETINIEDIEKSQYFIDYGNTLHNIMENIISVDDIDSAVDNAVLDGAIDSSKAIKLKNTLRRRINDVKSYGWFERERSDVYTETTFLTNSDDMRPDRIVKQEDGTYSIIDYKFGFTVDPNADDEQNNKYHEQVRQYMSTLQKAGFGSVKGYLWYFNKNVIIEIKQ